MTDTIDPIERLVLELGRLPGIGERSAARLAFYILRASLDSRSQGRESLAEDLAVALRDVVEKVGLCQSCANFSSADLCGICRNPKRDPTILCVVEGVADLRALERSGAFSGHYHVLHGVLAPLDGIGPEQLNLHEFSERIKSGGYREVILATNADVEGDTTALYVGRLLESLDVSVTRLASGVPLGGELEYIDRATLARALSDRRGL